MGGCNDINSCGEYIYSTCIKYVGTLHENSEVNDACEPTLNDVINELQDLVFNFNLNLNAGPGILVNENTVSLDYSEVRNSSWFPRWSEIEDRPTIPAQVNLIEGSNIIIEGRYPNLTISSVNDETGGITIIKRNGITLPVLNSAVDILVPTYTGSGNINITNSVVTLTQPTIDNINNGATAYSWGNHNTQGYITIDDFNVASENTFGIVQIGEGLTVADGVISMDVTQSSEGLFVTEVNQIPGGIEVIKSNFTLEEIGTSLSPGFFSFVSGTPGLIVTSSAHRKGNVLITKIKLENTTATLIQTPVVSSQYPLYNITNYSTYFDTDITDLITTIPFSNGSSVDKSTVFLTTQIGLVSTTNRISIGASSSITFDLITPIILYGM